MSPSPVNRLALRLVAAALLLWPRYTRERDGHALLAALSEDLASSQLGGLRWAARIGADLVAVAWAGLSLRWRVALGGMRTSKTDWRGDVSLALRGVRRSPGFTFMVWLTLALGIGANTAVFMMVDQVLFQPPPFREPDHLLLIWNTASGATERLRIPAPDAGEIRDGVPSLSAIAFMGRAADGSLEAAEGDAAVHVRVAPVTPNFFPLLGAEAFSGRLLGPTDGDVPPGADQATSPTVVVLSHETWIRILGGDPDAVDREIRLNGRPATVVGVLPAGFRVPMPPGTGMGGNVDVWRPLPTDLRSFQRPDGRRTDQDSDNTGAVVARLAPDAGLTRVRVELGFLADELATRVPEYATARIGFRAQTLWTDATQHLRGILRTLLMGVGIVLLITCLNLSTMVLARGAQRESEFAVRAALGAGRGRVIRQLVTENLLLFLPGAFLALLVATWIFSALSAFSPYEEGLATVSLNLRVPLIAGGLTLAVVFLAGLAPAARLASLERAGRTGSGFLRGGAHRSRARKVLLTTEVALSVTLLFGTFLLLKTAQGLKGADPGFDPRGALTFHLSMRIPGRYPGPRDRAELVRTIVARISNTPGVQEVGLTTLLPLSGRQWTRPYGLPGQPPDQWEGNLAEFRAITSGLFSALEIKVLEGRSFTAEEDRTEERRVVVVDEHLARRMAPRGSAVGLTIGIPLDGSEVFAEVVGVVGNVRYDRLDAESREVIYVPFRQEASREVSFIVRTNGDPATIAPAIRSTLTAIDPQLPIYDLRTLESYLDSAVAPVRFAGTVLGAFAVLALLALSMGLYGVVALEAARRTREIGLRMAVGARAPEVVASIMTSGFRLVGWGAVLGCVISILVLRVLKPSLYGTGIVDPWAWLIVAVCLGLVAGAACWLPARKAASMDPTTALRSDRSRRGMGGPGR